MANNDNIYNSLTNLDTTEESIVRSTNITDSSDNRPRTRDEVRKLLISQGYDPKKIEESDIDDYFRQYGKGSDKIVPDTTVNSAYAGIKEGYEELSANMEYNLLTTKVNDTRHINQINRFRFNQSNDGVLGKKAFIFMTRPNLNLFKTDVNDMAQCSLATDENGNLQLNTDLARLPTYNYIWNLGKNEFYKDTNQANPNLGLSIFESLNMQCGKHAGPWLSVVTNTATSYSVKTRELDVATAGATFHGNKVMYGEPTFTHKTAGVVSISFTDKRDLSLYYTMRIWLDYIHQVVLGTASPYRKYICKAMLDYAVSLYYIVTDETMENILYWEKLTGVFPVNTPDNIFDSNTDAFKGIENNQLDYTIDFSYSMRSVQHEHHLNEINALYEIARYNVNETTALKVNETGIHALNNTELTTNIKRVNTENILSAEFANNAFEYFNGKSSISTAADADRFEDYLNDIRNYYGMSDHETVTNTKLSSGKIKTTYESESPAWRYYSIIKNTDNEKAKFLANWLPDVQMHGVPFVHGPYITLGSSYSLDGTGNENITAETNEQSNYNKGQYKLRWI